MLARHDDPVKSVLTFSADHPADLIVSRHAPARGPQPLDAPLGLEPIARNSGQMTLFIPHGVEGFVSRDDGTVSLRSVLILMRLFLGLSRPSTSRRASFATFNVRRATFTTLWVGAMPRRCGTPETPGLEVGTPSFSRADVIDAIVHAARDTSADLIVMATDGRHGFLDGCAAVTASACCGGGLRVRCWRFRSARRGPRSHLDEQPRQ